MKYNKLLAPCSRTLQCYKANAPNSFYYFCKVKSKVTKLITTPCGPSDGDIAYSDPELS